MPERDLIPHPAHTSKGLMRMPVGRQNPGPLWVDGSIALRVRDKKQRTWRTVKIRHPHAVIGRHPAADLVIDRPDVADHHVFLFLDARGLFGVDLRTDRGTRFAGTLADAAWLGSGDLIEVGDHTIEVIQLRVDGAIVSGPLADDDPLGLVEPAAGKPASELILRPVDDPNANWAIGSSLVFLGRGPACAVRLDDPEIGLTHSALLRTASAAYLIQFPGETSILNDRRPAPAVRLAEADILTVGASSLRVQTGEPGGAVPRNFADLSARLEMAVGPDYLPDVELAFGHHPIPDGNPVDYPALLGRLQAETAAIIGVLLRRIEALDDEMAALRDRLDAGERDQARHPAAPPIEPLRWDLIPPAEADPLASTRSGAWLVERLRELEAERQTTWSNLVGRMGPNRNPEA